MVASEKAFGIKMGDNGGGGTDSPDGVLVQVDCQCICLCYLVCPIKSRSWRAVMEEVDKGRSKFCVTVGTVTRTAGILIHSWLKALAVNLSWSSGRLCMLA